MMNMKCVFVFLHFRSHSYYLYIHICTRHLEMLLSWLIGKEGKQAPIRRLIGNRGMMQQIDEMYNATTITLSPLLSL